CRICRACLVAWRTWLGGAGTAAVAGARWRVACRLPCPPVLALAGQHLLLYLPAAGHTPARFGRGGVRLRRAACGLRSRGGCDPPLLAHVCRAGRLRGCHPAMSGNRWRASDFDARTNGNQWPSSSFHTRMNGNPWTPSDFHTATGDQDWRASDFHTTVNGDRRRPSDFDTRAHGNQPTASDF